MHGMRTAGSGALRSSLGNISFRYQSGVIPHVVGERSTSGHSNFTKSQITKYAAKNRNKPTKSEAQFERIIRGLNGGILRDAYESQYPISGKWIVDFYFPEIRLAIEIDGSVHSTSIQRQRDAYKEADCERLDITLQRLSNDEVWGNQEVLIEKLRCAWRRAKRRENKIIGKPYSK